MQSRPTDQLMEPVNRMRRDVAKASVTLSINEARFLVDAFYTAQENRIRAENQRRSLSQSGEPHDVLEWLFQQSRVLENQIGRALDKYSEADPLGRWARSIVGIGPVIAAGLLAHIDISKINSAGAVWAYAGLDPTREWGKGEKRPWNATLKTLCWKIGESFVKTKGVEGAIYGLVYEERKQRENERNDAGLLADQAEAKLKKFNIRHNTDAYAAYSKGKLPPAHIHRRACRYAVKLFLAHYFEVGYFILHKERPPKPYALTHLEHADYIEPPGASELVGWK